MLRDTLALIQYSLFEGAAPTVENWDEVLQELRQHALMPLIRTDGLTLPNEVLSDFSQSFYSNLRSFYIHSTAVQNLNRILNQPVILKGLSAAQYYPAPVRRSVGDIDFMAHGEDFDYALSVLEANGYMRVGNLDLIKPQRHIELSKDNVTYEFHRYFSKFKNQCDRNVDAILASSKTVINKIMDFPIRCFPDEINGIVLVEHMSHHLNSGLGLRPMIDWACYVTAFLTDEVWKSQFQPLAAKCGLEELSVYATAFAEKYLGAPHRAFSDGADEETLELLLEEISDAGNFGRARNRMVSGIAGFRRSQNSLKRLQAGGLHRWEYAQTHKWVRPFAWLYQLFRIIGLIFTDKGSLSEEMKESNTVLVRLERLNKSLNIKNHIASHDD